MHMALMKMCRPIRSLRTLLISVNHFSQHTSLQCAGALLHKHINDATSSSNWQHTIQGKYSSVEQHSENAFILTPNAACLLATDKATEEVMLKDFALYEDFISEEEETSLFQEVEPYLKKLRYEFDHWDDAIHGFRETERREWTERNQGILQRVRDVAFPPGTTTLTHVHVLDLDGKGRIKPHVDSIRFCGDTIAGISLLSTAVMRLVNEKQKECHADMLVKRRSLYIMRRRARYDFTHEILDGDHSVFKGQPVLRERRISVICRNEPHLTTES